MVLQKKEATHYKLHRGELWLCRCSWVCNLHLQVQIMSAVRNADKSQTSFWFLKDYPRTTRRVCSTVWFMGRLHFYTEGFFLSVSMAPRCSGQWNLQSPLWSCNTRSSKYITIIRMLPLMGFEIVFNWTPQCRCVVFMSESWAALKSLLNWDGSFCS